MKSMSKDPWENATSSESSSTTCAGENHFEDSFVEGAASNHVKLEDSEEYLNKLCKIFPLNYFNNCLFFIGNSNETYKFKNNFHIFLQILA